MLRRRGVRVVSITEQADDTPTGKLHTMLANEAYTGAVVWGIKAKDKAEPVRVENAIPAIVSKREFQRAKKLLGSRAPKKVNPRRASSPYLLSGLLKCETCGKALTAAEAKSGKYTYYVCHSLLNGAAATCKTPRLNAKTFEKLIVDEIRANILTESNIRDLVKLLDEEMDGVASELRERLETIKEELEEVKRRLGRIWQVIETTDIEMADASERIREHRERKEKLEIAAQEARKLLSDRRQFLDSADTIATFAEDMSEFLKTSELTQTRAFVHSFGKEIEVKPGRAAIVYSIPTPEDSPIGGADAAEVALNGRVRSSVRHGGPGRIRTCDQSVMSRPLLPLSYGPVSTSYSMPVCLEVAPNSRTGRRPIRQLDRPPGGIAHRKPSVCSRSWRSVDVCPPGKHHTPIRCPGRPKRLHFCLSAGIILSS